MDNTYLTAISNSSITDSSILVAGKSNDESISISNEVFMASVS